MSKRFTLVTCGLALVVALVAGGVYLAGRTPPRAARLLPEAEAVVFLNLKPLRLATHFDRDPITRSPEFQHFIEATGFVPERDLDSAAFALHRMADSTGPNGPVAFSEVFIGRFDGVRVAKYLASVATKQEVYATHTIFDIPVEGRTLRVTQLVQDTIAASNAPTTEQIHAIIDRNRSGLTLFSPSSLLAARFPDVPSLSPAWALGRIGLPFAQHEHVTFSGLELPLSPESEFIGSLRYTSGLHLRIEQINASQDQAQRSVDNLKTLLAVFRLVHAVPPVSPADEPLLQLAETVQIGRTGSRAVFTATFPDSLLRRIAVAAHPAAP